MEFECDSTKSQTNKRKHGIDFEEAGGLWSDPHALQIELAYKEEPRFALIANLGRAPTKLWAAIFTVRSEKIRIISVRRARKDESQRYEHEQGEEH